MRVPEPLRDGLKRESKAVSRERQTLDRRPGSLPDIHTDAGSITFVMTPARAPQNARLVIRCDPDGELWISNAPASRSSE